MLHAMILICTIVVQCHDPGSASGEGISHKLDYGNMSDSAAHGEANRRY